MRAGLTPESGRFPTATTNACTAGAAPRTIGSLVVTPSAGDGAVVVVAAFGSARTEDCTAAHFATECIVSRRRFSFVFVDHHAVTLPILLDPSCAGVPCDESSTCEGQKCVDSLVQCAGGSCSPPGALPDGGVTVTDAASPIQVSTDASPTSDAALSPADAAPDSAVPDSGSAPEGGTTGCGPIAQCADTLVTACSAVGAQCCYTGGTTSCQQAGTCPGLWGCCRSAADCTGPDEVCCLEGSTSTGHLSCQPRLKCAQDTAMNVCSLQSTNCGGTHQCMEGSTVFPNAPSFFSCS